MNIPFSTEKSMTEVIPDYDPDVLFSGHTHKFSVAKIDRKNPTKVVRMKPVLDPWEPFVIDFKEDRYFHI